MTDQEQEGSFDPLEDPEERKHLLSVLDSFRSYRRLAHFNGTHVRRQAFYSLPSAHWTLLSEPPFSILDTFNQLDDLIDQNAELAEAIFKAGFKAFLAPSLDSDWVASVVPEKFAHDEYRVFSIVLDHMHVQTSNNDLEKARSCVNQFYREWSAEGAMERAKCFQPVLTTLEDEFASRFQKNPSLDKSDLTVLVPGSGLGRLVFDICRIGFRVEGNEISYHELMASALILNHTQRVNEFTIAPFALNSSNHLSRNDQMQVCKVPDVHPSAELASSNGSKVPADERMSMAAGDFCVLYSSPSQVESFDVVATVFFIDTASNIIRYIEAVHNCLKPGGLWINIGPLLWHHAGRKNEENQEKLDRKNMSMNDDAGIGDPGSVELSNEEVLALVQYFGFQMEKTELDIETGYISNPRSMLQNNYRPVFWIARKDR